MHRNINAMAQSMLPPAIMLLTPKYLPRLAAIVGLFTRYGLRDQELEKLQDDVGHARGRAAASVAHRRAAESGQPDILGSGVLAGLLIASAQLLPYWRALGTTGFVIAAVVGVYLVLSIMMSDRKRDRG